MESPKELQQNDTTITRVYSGKVFTDKIYKLFKYFQAEGTEPLEAIALMNMAIRVLEKHNGITESSVTTEKTHEA